MRAKLQSQKGLSLTEVLVAVAILAVLGAGVAFMLPASVRTFQDVTTGAEASVLCSTLSEAIADELRFAANVGEGPNPEYDSQRFGTDVRMAVNPEGVIEIQKKDNTGNFVLFRALLSKEVYTNGVKVNTLSYALGDGTGQAKNIFTVTLKVWSEQLDDTDEPRQFSESTFNVTALNLAP